MDLAVQLAGQEQTVDVAGEIAFHRQVARRKARRVAKGEHRPVGQQHANEPIPEPTGLREVEDEEQLGAHPGQADAAEDAGEAHVFDALPLQAIIVDDAQQHEDEAAEQDLADHFHPGAGAQAARERERRRDPGQEKEQREDEVLEMETVPGNVFELLMHDCQPRPVRELQQRGDDGMPTDDPEEVEAPQGIQGQEARGVIR